MKINGFDLPPLFVDAISVGRLKREIGCLDLIQNIDAYAVIHLRQILARYFILLKGLRKRLINYQQDLNPMDIMVSLLQI
jgi:hypothetical protein